MTSLILRSLTLAVCLTGPICTLAQYSTVDSNSRRTITDDINDSPGLDVHRAFVTGGSDGDLNGDGVMDIDDVTIMIDHVLTGEPLTILTGPYVGKKIAVIGDSFTAPNKWQKYMCELLGATLISDGSLAVGAVSGGRYAGADSSRWGYTLAQSLGTYCVENDIAPDYILICLGTNDVANMRSSGSTLGNINYSATSVDDIGTTLVINNANITAGIQATLLYLKTRFPDAIIKVGYTPAGVIHSGENLLVTYRQQFMQRLEEVCAMYGVSMIDSYTCGISQYVSADAPYMSGSHPSDAGQQRIGEYMARLMLNNL